MGSVLCFVRTLLCPLVAGLFAVFVVISLFCLPLLVIGRPGVVRLVTYPPIPLFGRVLPQRFEDCRRRARFSVGTLVALCCPALRHREE